MRTVVVGGSAAGLFTALLLGRAGHEVTVLDRDVVEPAADVDSAAAKAFRVAAPQIVQAHAGLPRLRQLLTRHLPDVYSELLAAGVVEGPLSASMPPSLADRTSRPRDEQLTMLLSRRSTIDWVLRRAAAEQSGITVHHGVTVTGLRVTGDSPPRVTGIVTDAGTLTAELVADATGRRTAIDAWLRVAGCRPSTMQAAECGLAYFTRHYRLREGTRPETPPGRTILPLEQFTCGMWWGDNDTMVLCLAPLVEDRRFAGAAQPAVFEAVLRTTPPLARWLDLAEPTSRVYPMGGLHNTMRELVVDGAPVANAIVAVGDSLCTTNPTFGRGLVLSLSHAIELTRCLEEHDNPTEASMAFHRRTADNTTPFYRDQALNDAARLAALRHSIFGSPAPSSQPASNAVSLAELREAGMVDPILFRAFWRLMGMIEKPDDVYRDPAVVERTRQVLTTAQRPAAFPQPDSRSLLAALAT